AAETVLLKAVELEPRLLSAYLRLGNLYVHSGEHDHALAPLEQAVRTSPNNPGPLMVVGTVYEMKGDIPKPRETYEKVLAINPRFGAAANNLAWIYSDNGGDRDKSLHLS